MDTWFKFLLGYISKNETIRMRFLSLSEAQSIPFRTLHIFPSDGLLASECAEGPFTNLLFALVIAFAQVSGRFWYVRLAYRVISYRLKLLLSFAQETSRVTSLRYVVNRFIFSTGLQRVMRVIFHLKVDNCAIHFANFSSAFIFKHYLFVCFRSISWI